MTRLHFASAGLAACLAGAAFGQVSFTGTYSQDFNGLGQTGATTVPGKGPHAIQGILGSTGILGWFGANFDGSSANTEYKAHDGSLASAAGRGVIFFGADGSSERALGALPTSNQVPAFGVVLVNESSETFASLEVSYAGEQWRAGSPNLSNALAFSYGYGTSLTDATTTVPALTFVAPNLAGGEVALDGNDAANRAPISGVLSGLNWRPGQTLVLRWDSTDLSGQDNGLAIDDLSILATAGITSFDLADYELSATYPLPFPAAEEASGVTYNWNTGTLFVVGDEGLAVVEVTTTGELVSQMALTGFQDVEGITYIGGNQFVLVEERIQDVFLLTYVAGGTADRASLPGISLGPTVGNVGLEGISFDPRDASYVTVKEKTPQGVFGVTLDWVLLTGVSTPLFTPEPTLGLLDLSDVQVLAAVPTLVGTKDEDNLLIYSQESSRLLETSRAGEVLSSFDFANIAGNAEGVTIAPDGTVYVVGENPSLYVLTPIRTPPCLADLTGDGAVNGADLTVLLGSWGSCDGCPADLDGDGAVSAADLTILLGAWGACAR